MYMIVGLGNPGLKYRHTRHNAGFDCIDALAEKYQIEIKKHEQNALTGTGVIEGTKVLLVKPQTFMNNSGEAVGPLASYYGIDPESEIIIFSDDVTLEAGVIRIRKKGSAGGHNGLKSIEAHLHTANYQRIKLGVGVLPQGGDMIKHVLTGLPREERKNLEDAFERAGQAALLMMQGETDKAMNLYNTKSK